MTGRTAEELTLKKGSFRDYLGQGVAKYWETSLPRTYRELNHLQDVGITVSRPVSQDVDNEIDNSLILQT